MDDLALRYTHWLSNNELLCQMYVFFVNNRLHDTQDPLTHTLILMTTMPIQFVFCESGVLPFRTPNLPIYPFTDMTRQQRVDIAALLSEVPSQNINESVEGCGKISVVISLGTRTFVEKVLMTRAFIHAVVGRSQLPLTYSTLPRRFCRIIFQRFISSVSMTPSQVNELLEYIDVDLHCPTPKVDMSPSSIHPIASI